MTFAVVLILGWCAALWAHHLAAPRDAATTVVFGALGLVVALVSFFIALDERPWRDGVAFVAPALLGPLLGWLIGSSAVVPMTSADAVPRLVVRVLLCVGAPAIAAVAMFARGRPGRAASLLAVVIFGFAALTGASAARDLARGVVSREVVVTGVNYEHRTWVAYLEGDAIELDPDRHDVATGDRGHARYLAVSNVLLDWSPSPRDARMTGPYRDVPGAGLGRASIFAILVAEAILVAALVATRARLLVAIALVVPLVCFSRFFLLTAFGRPVEATIIDKGSTGWRTSRGLRTWSYRYALRARSDDGHALGADADADGYRAVAIGDRVRFVAGPLATSALRHPEVATFDLVWFGIVSSVAIAFARRARDGTMSGS